LNNIFGLAGAQPNGVWAVGDGGSIYLWDGTSWNADTSLLRSGSLSMTEKLTAIFTDPAGNALAVGNPNGLLLRYSVATRSWSRPIVNKGTSLQDVWLKDISDGWAVGGDTTGAAFHWNGAWSANLCFLATKPLQGVWGLAGDRVWAVGQEGVIYQLKPSSCEQVQTGLQTPLYDIWGTEDELWAVGAEGRVIHACISP
jgi:hypothetical protein